MFNPHIPLDLNLINYKNKYKYIDYITNQAVQFTTQITGNPNVESLISGNNPVFSDWLTGYTTKLVTKFNNDVLSANDEYNTISNGTGSKQRLSIISANMINYTEKYKKAQLNLYDHYLIFPTNLYNHANDLKDGATLTYECTYITGTILSSGIKSLSDNPDWNQVIRRNCN